MKIIVSSHILLQEAPPRFARIIREKLTIQNPAFIEAKKRGRWTGSLEQELRFYQVKSEGLILPRGFVLQLIRLATQTETSWKIIDQRRTLPTMEFIFTGKPRDYQREAVQDILQHDFGTLSAPTGSGKTTMALAVIAKMLRSLYLHREIREKGGAYGGFAIYSTQEGIFSFGSYRDPNIRRTIKVFQEACDFILTGDYSEQDIKEAVLQVCAEIDKPETPGPAAIKAFYRDVLMLTDERRKSFKSELLALDMPTIKACAQRYFKAADTGKGTAVISGKELLRAANENREPGAPALEIHRI